MRLGNSSTGPDRDLFDLGKECIFSFHDRTVTVIKKCCCVSSTSIQYVVRGEVTDGDNKFQFVPSQVGGSCKNNASRDRIDRIIYIL